MKRAIDSIGKRVVQVEQLCTNKVMRRDGKGGRKRTIAQNKTNQKKREEEEKEIIKGHARMTTVHSSRERHHETLQVWSSATAAVATAAPRGPYLQSSGVSNARLLNAWFACAEPSP